MHKSFSYKPLYVHLKIHFVIPNNLAEMVVDFVDPDTSPMVVGTDQASDIPGGTDQASDSRGGTDQASDNRGGTDQASDNRTKSGALNAQDEAILGEILTSGENPYQYPNWIQIA